MHGNNNVEAFDVNKLVVMMHHGVVWCMLTSSGGEFFAERAIIISRNIGCNCYLTLPVAILYNSL
jgi:hypothetical protein